MTIDLTEVQALQALSGPESERPCRTNGSRCQRLPGAVSTPAAQRDHPLSFLSTKTLAIVAVRLRVRRLRQRLDARRCAGRIWLSTKDRHEYLASPRGGLP